MKSGIQILFVSLLMAFAGMAAAEEEALTGEAMIKQRLLDARPDLPISKVRRAPIDGFYEVLVGGMTLYVDESGEHFFAGDLFFVQPQGFVNASENIRIDRRRELLEAMDEDDMVVFAPAPELVKATITVFTDIDCGYCRKLHQEVPELNRYGIAVRYLAYPRAGVGSASYDLIVSAWCADNRQLALTKAKNGQEIDQLTCANPVAKQYSMGDEFGVTGTPAIIYETGYLQSGYAPAAEMARRLGVLN